MTAHAEHAEPQAIRHGANGWELVAYDRKWMPDVALLTYEHPRHGMREVLRRLRSGRIVS